VASPVGDVVASTKSWIYDTAVDLIRNHEDLSSFFRKNTRKQMLFLNLNMIFNEKSENV